MILNKNKRWILTLVLIPLLFLLFKVGSAQIQSMASYFLKKSTVDMGGGQSASTSYKLVDAIGQPISGGMSTGNNYALSAGFITGQTSSQSEMIVWPGDANNDGRVNQGDILPIGLFWAMTGPARPGASMVWTGQPAPEWSPKNATYANANGDGIINQMDVLPIGLNWGKTHSLLSASSGPNNTMKSAQSSSEKLVITTDADIRPNSICRIAFIAQEVTNLFGISFEMSCPSMDFIDSVQVEQQSWLGDDIIFYPMVEVNAGKVSFGISRKAGQKGMSGTGAVAVLKLRLKGSKIEEIPLSLQNICANDHLGNPIQFEAVNFTLTVKEELPGTKIPDAFELKQNYPNPFNPETFIEYHLPQSAEVNLTVFDINGKEVRQLVHATKPAGSHSARWNATDNFNRVVASGTYFYRIEIKSREASFIEVKKLVFMK